jgi:hypothetical protein
MQEKKRLLCFFQKPLVGRVALCVWIVRGMRNIAFQVNDILSDLPELDKRRQ